MSDEQSDSPLAVWTCDWLALKGRPKEALDRLLKLDRLLSIVCIDPQIGSTANELAKLAVDTRIAACFWSLGQKESAKPYFQDLTRLDDLEAPLDGMPQTSLQSWQQGKTELEKQQNIKGHESTSCEPQSISIAFTRAIILTRSESNRRWALRGRYRSRRAPLAGSL